MTGQRRPYSGPPSGTATASSPAPASSGSDFGIAGVTNTAAPWQLEAKIDPATGKQDDGEYLSIDTTKLGAGSTATTSTATVTIHVTG